MLVSEVASTERERGPGLGDGEQVLLYSVCLGRVALPGFPQVQNGNTDDSQCPPITPDVRTVRRWRVEGNICQGRMKRQARRSRLVHDLI